jgi:hypothetical protein
MGLFSKPAPLDPIFLLPSVKKMDCTQLNFPCKSEIAMMNFKWLDKQMSSGTYQDPLILVNRVMESAEFWKKIEVVNLDVATNSLVQYVMSIESLSLNEDDFAELYMAANFGLLAGLFESSSKTTEKNACHPEIWNAMSRLGTMRRDERGGQGISEKDSSFLFLCQKTGEAGYVMGKLGGLTLGEIFKRWNDVR